jgi:hypothetical protein
MAAMPEDGTDLTAARSRYPHRLRGQLVSPRLKPLCRRVVSKYPRKATGFECPFLQHGPPGFRGLALAVRFHQELTPPGRPRLSEAG